MLQVQRQSRNVQGHKSVISLFSAGDFACHHLLVCDAERDSSEARLLSALDIARGMLVTSSALEICKEAGAIRDNTGDGQQSITEDYEGDQSS